MRYHVFLPVRSSQTSPPIFQGKLTLMEDYDWNYYHDIDDWWKGKHVMLDVD